MSAAVKIANTKKISHDDWLRLRQKGIGGSEAGVILGVNPYETMYELWLRKTNRIGNKATNKAMQRGIYLEPLVVDMFVENNEGAKVRRVNQMLQSREHSFMIANLDRAYTLADGKKGVLECKTTAGRNAHKWLEEPPEYYQAQTQHYLAVTGMSEAIIAVTIGEDLDYKQFVVPRDDAFIALLIEQEERFWWYVTNDKEPPDKSFTDADVLKELFRTGNGQRVQLSGSLEPVVRRYLSVKDEYKTMGKEVERLENMIKGELGDNEFGTLPSGIVVEWKTIYKSRVSSEEFKSKYPDIHAELYRKAPERRFSVKI